MGFRPPLDIADYVDRLGGDGARSIGYRAQRPRTPSVGYSSDDLADRLAQVDPEKPFLRGWGPAEASTCTDVELTPTVIWDVNGYYRALGFEFPYRGITRKDLREGYQRVGGQRSVKTTYAFKQLLDPYVRFDYDRMELGDRFFDDFVSEEIKLSAVKEAGRRTAESGEVVDGEEILDEWGLKSVSDDKAPKPRNAKVSDPDAKVPWEWAYYLWQSGEDNRDRLARWQEMLISGFARNGIRRMVSVGFFGKQPHSWVSARVGNRTVIFLSEDVEPTAQMAEQAVAYLHDTDTDK